MTYDTDLKRDDAIHNYGLDRLRLRQKLAEVEANLGPLLRDAHASGRSLTSLGHAIGASHPYVQRLIAEAPDKGAERDWTVPAIHARELVSVVGDMRLRRIIGGFTASDVLHQSRLHPSLFVCGYGSLVVPHVLVELDIHSDERWLGLQDVNVGYGGTGPGNAAQALQSLGFPSHICDAMYRFRFFDLDCRTGQFIEADVDGPRYPLESPLFRGDAFVLDMHPDWVPVATGNYVRGRDPRPEGVMSLNTVVAWLKESPDQRSDWPGRWEDRVARIYFDDAAAEAHGFVHRRPDRRTAQPCQVVIEQKDLQVWPPLYRPSDQRRYLSDEAYQVLGLFELIPRELLAQDSEARVLRWLRSYWTNNRRPPWVDLSPDQDRTLQHFPL